MVLYHANGRVVKQHDQYLDDEARNLANHYRYIEQIDICNQKTADASTDNVEIIIDEQEYRTLYYEKGGLEWEVIRKFRRKTPYTNLRAVDRATLMMCSTFADDHFRYNPGEKTLHLPVCYPRQHHSARPADESMEDFDRIFGGTSVAGKKLAEQSDSQMAFVRPKEIEQYVIPWLEKVQKQRERAETPRREEDDARPPKKTKRAHDLVKPHVAIPMNIPDALEDKIHLYNAMLQLGLPKFVQLVRNTSPMPAYLQDKD